jgi:hypothetical protein
MSQDRKLFTPQTLPNKRVQRSATAKYKLFLLPPAPADADVRPLAASWFQIEELILDDIM